MATITKNMSNLDIYNAATMLLENFKEDLNLPVKINFYLQKNMTAVVDLAKEIDKARMEIIQKYAEPLEEGDEQYTIKPEFVETVNSEITDLLALEQEVKVRMIALEAFDNVDLSAGQVSAIMFMIDEDEE